jgi:hypothetical protein
MNRFFLALQILEIILFEPSKTTKSGLIEQASKEATAFSWKPKYLFRL